MMEIFFYAGISLPLQQAKSELCAEINEGKKYPASCRPLLQI